jgi:hypothetical protein
MEKSDKNQFFLLVSTNRCFLGLSPDGHPQLGSPQA